jgi:Gpi18-like mannosyltransferase
MIPMNISINRIWYKVILIYLSSKVYQAIFVYWGHAVRGPAPPRGWEGVNKWILNPWTTYDSQWYLEIASKGYSKVSATFFPLYPLLLKFCGNSEVTRAFAGVIISNLAFLLALYFLYRLSRLDFPEETAWTTVWIAAFFPTAAFFGAVYTESLFFLLLLLTFYVARKSNWMSAGICGALAGATRNPAPVIFISLLVEYFYQLNYNVQRIKLKPILCICFVLSGFVGYMLYLYWRFGDPFLTITSHKYFYRGSAWPWEAVVKDTLDFITGRGMDIVTMFNLLSAVLFLYLPLKYYKIFRPSYLLIPVAIAIMLLMNPRVPPPHTIGALRFASVLFPLLQMLAISYTNFSQRSEVIKYLAFASYLMLNAAFSYMFGLKNFIS